MHFMPKVPDNSTLPGTPTQSNNLPPLGGFQISPPQTIDDLIVENADIAFEAKSREGTREY
jgi:hypothetical protein